MRHKDGQAQAGFTLLEVLLAIAITAVVMTTVTMTFTITLQSRQVIDGLSESTEAGPRIINLIERDLRALWHHNVRDNKVLVGRNMDVASFEADRIDMLTSTDSIGYVLDNVGRQRFPTICEVGYWLKQHPKYGDLIELWRREDPMLDQDLLTEGSFQLVHDRIKSFKITYYKTLGAEAEEFFEWDSSVDDELPRRIRIEFTLERKRGSRNIVSDAEIADFEGAEKTYVRHIVLDRRYEHILRAGVAMVPILPPPPEEEAPEGPAGPAGPGGEGPRGPAGGPGGPAATTQFGGAAGGRADIKSGAEGGRGTRTTVGGSRDGGGRGGATPVPGNFDINQLFRGAGGGNIFGGGGGR